MKGSTSVPPTLRFGVFEFDSRAGELRKRGMKIRLQGQPLEILALLLEHPGEIVTREELQKKLWPADTFVDFEQGLNNAMKRLRAGLDDNAETPRFIETVPRRGYRFIGQVNGLGQTLQAVGQPSLWVSRWQRFIATAVAGSIVLAVLVKWSRWRTTSIAPKILSTVQLTSDGQEKLGPIATDGSRVYFSEEFEEHSRIAAVQITGGQPVPIHTPFPDAQLLNISPDRSELLVAEGGFAGWFSTEKPLWVVPILGGLPRRLGNVVGHDGSWSPNGQTLVYAHGSTLTLIRADGTEPRLLLPPATDLSVWALHPTWSPDGSRLRFELYDTSKHVSTLWEISADGRNLRPVLPGWQDPPTQCCSSWTPDGHYYLFGSWKNLVGDSHLPGSDIWAIRENLGWFRRRSQSPIQLTAGPVHFWYSTPSPDGKLLFAISSLHRGELMRYDTKAQRLSPYQGGVSIQGVNFSRDGVWMAYVTFPKGELWRSRKDGSEPLQLTFSPFIVHDPHWSPDGKQIVYSALKPGAQWQIYVVSRDGSAPQRLLPDSMRGIDCTWSADGSSVLFAQPPAAEHNAVRYTLQMLNLQTRRLSAVPGSEGLRSARFSPDGRYISAISAKDDKLMLFDFVTQKWIAQGPKDIGFQSWSHDSKYVYFLGSDVDLGVFRVGVGNNKVEKILSLKDFHTAGTFGAWLSLTPEDDPLVLRDVGPPEIYALSWEAP